MGIQLGPYVKRLMTRQKHHHSILIVSWFEVAVRLGLFNCLVLIKFLLAKTMESFTTNGAKYDDTGGAVTKSTKKESDVVRNETRLKLWLSYELSALKIQRVYRCWKFSHEFRNNISRKNYLNKLKLAVQPNLSDTFKNIINDESTHDEKMQFWRSIIELRKAHNSHSTDTLIKALVESKGDLSRAITLAGTKEFVAVNTTDLSSKVRHLFLPVPSLRHRDGSNNAKNTNKHNSNSEFTHNVFSQTAYSPAALASTKTSSNNIELIRSLREKKRQNKKNELHDVLNSVLAKAYFSKNHTNKTSKQDVKKLQKQINPHTVKAKHTRINRLEHEQTMHYLSTTAAKWNVDDS